MPHSPKIRHLHHIDEKVDTLVVMLKMTMKRIILIKTQQSWLRLDPIGSIPGPHSLKMPS